MVCEVGTCQHSHFGAQVGCLLTHKRTRKRCTVVYLASDESSCTTGVAHVIDGGWSSI